MSSVPLRTRVKICGLSREQDVDAAVEAGADAIGLVLYPKSPRYVSAQRAGELARLLPPFVQPVLLFVTEPLAGVRAACAQGPGATLQFHGAESPAFCRAAAGARPWLRASSTSRIHCGGCRPWPTYTRQPMRLRIMWCRKALAWNSKRQ